MRCSLDINRLRLETAANHAAVEACMPLMGEDLDRESYIGCLRRLHGVVAAWEDWACERSPAWMQSLWEDRQRQHWLEQDLASFGVLTLDQARPALPEMKDDASVLGAMYVMEGSTLGGRIIARHVERVLHLHAGLGDAYFRGHADRTASMWKGFLDVLHRKVPDRDTPTVIVAAQAMFRCFGSWMQMPAQ